MNRLVLIAALAAASSSCAKTYSGQEAAALRCVAILTVVPSSAARAGLIAYQEVEVFNFLAGGILLRYVSGTERERSTALAIVVQRYDVDEHIRDFLTKAETCLAQFPL